MIFAIFHSNGYRIEDVTFKFPRRLENVAEALTAPKPDILFGTYLNRATVDSDVYESQEPGIFSLDHHTMSVLTAQEFSEISCGAIGEQFCFPTVAIQRKSDSGSVISLKINYWDYCVAFMNLNI